MHACLVIKQELMATIITIIINIIIIFSMFVSPYILVTYMSNSSPTDVHYILYFLDNVSSTCFGCYLHPSSGAQLQRRAIGFVWFGVLFHWSRLLVWDTFTLVHGQLRKIKNIVYICWT
jgi:hypothetical protein